MKQERQKQRLDNDQSPDQAAMWRAATAEERLNWLEKASEFVQIFVSAEKIRWWRQYRQKENPKS